MLSPQRAFRGDQPPRPSARPKEAYRLGAPDGENDELAALMCRAANSAGQDYYRFWPGARSDGLPVSMQLDAPGEWASF